MYKFILLLSTLWIIAFSCSPKKAEESEQTEIFKFNPDPQPVAERDVKVLPVGSKAPDFRLPGTDGRFYSLKDFDQARALVLIFTCNHCPTAQAYEQRIIDIVNDYQDRNVQVVAISPNSPLALLYEECGYSDMGDDYEEMILRAAHMDFNFPYLYDGDNHEGSLPYGPVATPHAYVFDENRILRYTGRLDASEKPGTANAEDLRAAIDAVLEGREVEVKETKTFGCSVKWAWKDEWTAKINKDWENAPVNLDEIDVEGLKKLVNNDSDKLRLINIWATWCGPCVIEYPEFVIIHRMFSGRDFEFVSVSADKLEQKDKALKFLKQKHSALQNYIFSEEDKYALIEAVDPDWDGALPYTVLVAPGGEKVYVQMGVIDPLKLKRAIVDHPMIGRYY
ncbi:MAG: redoxin domain-containing protein [Cyclobacteriaceae bacterium]|nr:redoxin domain-containing protein [Cyclobacteriaceae bacterium]